MTMATRALLGTTTTTTSLTLVVSRRMMGTGIFGINNKDPFRAPKNLTRMVAREEKRAKRCFMKMDTPKTLNFIDNPKMKHFNVIFKENLSLVIFGSRIKAVVVSSNVKFTKVRVTPAFTDVFIYWTMTTSLEDEASSIDRVQRDLDAAAPDIRHDMAQLKVLGKMPKIMFVKDTDVAATADELLDKLATFRQLAPPTDQPSEAYSATQEAELKTNILRFNRQRTMDEILQAMERAKALHRHQ